MEVCHPQKIKQVYINLYYIIVYIFYYYALLYPSVCFGLLLNIFLMYQDMHLYTDI